MVTRLPACKRQSDTMEIGGPTKARKANSQTIRSATDVEMQRTRRFVCDNGRSSKNRTSAYRYEKILAKLTETTRKSWLTSLCEARAADGNLSKEQELKNRIRTEEQRRNARIIRRVNGKLRSGSVTSVVAPDENGIWREVTGKVDMEQALLDENKRRFTQASNTPFLQLPLLQMVGPLGTGPAAERF